MTTLDLDALVFCECGCGERAPLAKRTNARRGMRRGRPLRFLPGHNSRVTDPLSKVESGPGCWKWLGSHGRKGYGRAHHRGVHTGAHRVVYELLVGPIPEGHDLDHLCRNPGCVNPSHLEPVTPAENRRRQASTHELLDRMIARG